MRTAALIVVVGCFIGSVCVAAPLQRDVNTQFYSVTLSQDGSTIEALSVDSLGHGEFRPGTLLVQDAKPATQTVATDETPVSDGLVSDWDFKFSPKSFQMTSTYRSYAPEQAIVLRFDLLQSHATLLKVASPCTCNMTPIARTRAMFR
jgi:hypothetical protein